MLLIALKLISKTDDCFNKTLNLSGISKNHFFTLYCKSIVPKTVLSELYKPTIKENFEAMSAYLIWVLQNFALIVAH